MRAVVWKAPYQVTVEEVEDPRIEAPGDADGSRASRGP